MGIKYILKFILLFYIVSVIMNYAGLWYVIHTPLASNHYLTMNSTADEIDIFGFLIFMVIAFVTTKLTYAVLRGLAISGGTYSGGNNNAWNYNDKPKNLFPETKYYGQGGREITRLEDNWERNKYPEKYDIFGNRKFGE